MKMMCLLHQLFHFGGFLSKLLRYCNSEKNLVSDNVSGVEKHRHMEGRAGVVVKVKIFIIKN
jgi:hypothetical protein